MADSGWQMANGIALIRWAISHLRCAIHYKEVMTIANALI